jgi:lysophospholipase L1-like esterase
VPFFGVMSVVRIMNRLTGNDPLHLRSRESPTYWLPSDDENRRARHVKSMFCSERLVRGRLAILPWFMIGVLLLGSTEAGLRLYGYGRPILFIQDPDIGYYPKPSQQARYPGRVVSINNHGMRAADIGPQKTPGRVRILMIGDSTLAGTKVSNAELYSSLLEKKLNHLAGKPVFEVLNMGVNAWGPLHERAFIRKFGTFDADVAIICGPVANCFRPRYGLERLPFSPAERPPRTALGHVAYEMMWRLRERTLGVPPWAFPGPIQDAQAREGTAAYADMAALFQQHGAEVLMEMLPARQVTLGNGSDPDGERLFVPIRIRMEEIGVIANCAGPIFKDVKDKETIYHDGVHFDRYGHRLYAEYLAGRLQEQSTKIRASINR